MATMNVSLPDPMKEWVEAQAQGGRYSNVSDYVRDLIRRDQERAAKIGRLPASDRRRAGERHQRRVHGRYRSRRPRRAARRHVRAWPIS